MMNIVEINAVPYGSTGKIMFSLADLAKSQGHNIVCTTGFSWAKSCRNDWFLTSNLIAKGMHMIFSRFTGKNGCYSYLSTKRLICKLAKISPDVIHLHNLHGWYINLPVLFKYIKQHHISVVWTLHDCWAFTGQCPHFDLIKCDKWKIGCHRCPQYRQYPQSYVDRTKTMYKLKKKWFTGVQNMTIVTPSQWLANLVKQSFLKEYPVEVINNGIDLSVFKPTESNFKEKYNLQGKFLILGVSFEWGARKGIDVFINLASELDERFQIVLVGTDDKVDKQLPSNIISIHRTHSQQELAEIYAAADVFVNPTREEVFGLVNIEALACGIPVITFSTGGSPECIDSSCGVVVGCDDNAAMMHEIIRICEAKPFSKEMCINRGREFDMNEKFSKYIDLYKCVAYRL